MSFFMSTLNCLVMSPIIPTNATIILLSVSFEFTTYGPMVSLDPSNDLSQGKTGTR